MSRMSLFMLIFMLFGCEPQGAPDDLKRYISQTYAAAKATSTTLPPEPRYFPLPFSPSVEINPFVLPLDLGKENYGEGDCWQPKDLPKKDPLENFELSSLSFKGVMGLSGQYWALIETPDKSIHRVGIGRMLGSNRGRVDRISSQTLSITEHLPDGLGCWQVRHVRMRLTMNKVKR